MKVTGEFSKSHSDGLVGRSKGSQDCGSASSFPNRWGKQSLNRGTVPMNLCHQGFPTLPAPNCPTLWVVGIVRSWLGSWDLLLGQASEDLWTNTLLRAPAEKAGLVRSSILQNCEMVTFFLWAGRGEILVFNLYWRPVTLHPTEERTSCSRT